jgi:hypothetical protein
LLPLLSSIFIFSPGLSFSEVKISLRNGREIIADRCRDSNGKLICEKMGGQFEIEKKDVSNLKEITVRRQALSPEPEAGVSGEKQISDEKSAGEAAVEGGKTGSQKRLDEINQRKRELITERESLTKEREKLNAEFRREGDVLSQAVFDSYQKRFNEIEAKINSFNEENRKLNEEEQSILKEMGRNAEGVK